MDTSPHPTQRLSNGSGEAVTASSEITAAALDRFQQHVEKRHWLRRRRPAWRPARSRCVLCPAPPGTGIVFRRTDLGIDIPARFDLVADVRLCTLLALPHQPEARVGTVEHLMAALAACAIDNLVVEVDGPEVPIFDGSAAPFLFLNRLRRARGPGPGANHHRSAAHRARQPWRGLCRAAAGGGRERPADVAQHRLCRRGDRPAGAQPVARRGGVPRRACRMPHIRARRGD